MKTLILWFACLILLSCNEDYTYIQPENYSGILLQSRRGVYKMKVRVEAKSKCKSLILFQVDSTIYTFYVNNYIDTSFSRDWYENPMFIKVDTDSCLVNDPVIGVKFFD